MKKIGARSFLLLELLIALTLVTLCILPFIRIPSKIASDELLSLQRLQLQHVSDRTVALIKEYIYQEKISWEQLCREKEKKELLIEDEIYLPVKELSKQRFKRKCTVYSTGKKGPNEEDYRLVRIEVYFKKIPGKMAFLSWKKKKSLRFVYQILLTQENAKTPPMKANEPGRSPAQLKN